MPSSVHVSYPLLFQHIPAGILLVSPEGPVHYANPSMQQLLGDDDADSSNLDISDIFNAPEGKSISAVMAALTLGETKQTCWQLRRPDDVPLAVPLAVIVTLEKLSRHEVLCIVQPASSAAFDEIQKNRFVAIVESSNDAIIGKDVDGIITSWNAGAERIFGYTADEMLGTSIMHLIPPDRQEEEVRIRDKLRAGERVEHFETRRLTKDKRLIDVSVTISPIRDAMGRIVGASKIARDITRKKALERQMARMSRIYAALAEINQAIARASDRDTLFQDSCRLLIEKGGLEMAWIGWNDPKTHRLVPIASHGDESGYLEHLDIDTDAPGERSGPQGHAFRSGAQYICNDTRTEPSMQPWQEITRQAGYRGCVTFPIKDSDEVLGTLSVYVRQQDFFQTEEISLLREVARDLSNWIHSHALEEARKQYERVAISEKTFSDTMLESVPGIVILFDAQGKVLRWNRSLATLTGYSEPEIAQMLPADFFPEDQQPQIIRAISEILQTGQSATEGAIKTKSGSTIPHLFYGKRVELVGTSCVAAIGVDISRLKQYEHRLQEQEEMFREMSAMAHVGAWKFDPVTGDGQWTEEVAHIHGLSPDAKTSAAIGLEFYHGVHRERIEAAVQDAIKYGKPYDLELQLTAATGTQKWIRTMCHPIMDHGRVVAVRGSIQDISDRKAYEERIKGLNRVLTVLSQINGLIVRVKDRDELFNEACRITTQAGGFPLAMVALVTPQGGITPVASEGKDERLMDEITEAMTSPHTASGTMISKALKEQHPIIANVSDQNSAMIFSSAYTDGGIRSIVVLPLIVADRAIGVLMLHASENEFFHAEEMRLLNELSHDIAFAVDHLDKQERLDFLAYYDALTGLSNRKLFLDRVGQFMRADNPEQKMALFLIDLARFKMLNDSLGRSVGDTVLIQIAEWLKQYAVDANLLARIGSDHFAIAMPQLRNADDAARLVEKILASLQEHTFDVNDNELRIGATIGLALYPDDGQDAETLLMHAEAALKRAKASGDPYLFHTRQMTASVAAMLSLENRLRRAIEREEFVLHYQPKINLATGRVTSAEALIRWQDPKTGLLPPADFIPLLETTGLIREVGRWVLRKSVDDILRWRDAGLTVLPVAVNVSAQQLRDPDFMSLIAEKIDIDPKVAETLELEITESVIMEDIERSVETLEFMRELGIRVAIDDFGTGFSSLNYLSRLPVDILKIDRSFILQMTENPEGLSLVSTIINLAHSLKLKVVAEGVDSEEQSRLLRLLNCDEMQGFLFSKPVPADVFAERFMQQE